MIAIPEELCADLVGHLELVARGAIPSPPERGAELLRRLKFAITQSGRGLGSPHIIPRPASDV
jgi:hypothetical protein